MLLLDSEGALYQLVTTYQATSWLSQGPAQPKDPYPPVSIVKVRSRFHPDPGRPRSTRGHPPPPETGRDLGSCVRGGHGWCVRYQLRSTLTRLIPAVSTRTRSTGGSSGSVSTRTRPLVVLRGQFPPGLGPSTGGAGPSGSH